MRIGKRRLSGKSHRQNGCCRRSETVQHAWAAVFFTLRGWAVTTSKVRKDMAAASMSSSATFGMTATSVVGERLMMPRPAGPREGAAQGRGSGQQPLSRKRRAHLGLVGAANTLGRHPEPAENGAGRGELAAMMPLRNVRR